MSNRVKRNSTLTLLLTIVLPAIILTKPDYLGAKASVAVALLFPVAFALYDFWGDIKRKESMLLNLSLNLIIPMMIFIKLSSNAHLGTQLAVILAVSVPATYGIVDYFRIKKFNIFSALGVVSILLTGGIALLELDPKYIAIKEATIPGIIFIAVLASLKTPYPLVKTVVYNRALVQVDKVTEALKRNNNEKKFERSLTIATFILAFSFFLSSVLNFILAKLIVVSPAGTEAFNQELGKLMGLSYPVIAVPSTLILFGALIYLGVSISKFTSLKLEEIFVDPDAEDEADTSEGTNENTQTGT